MIPLLSFHPPIIAHRGAGMNAPENTLAAVREAHAQGATWIEVDVKITYDGVPVLMHDETLDRTTNGAGLVAETTWDTIQGLDAGINFDPRFKGEQVPLLSEIIKSVLSYDMSVVVEIKPCPGRAKATTMVRSYKIAPYSCSLLKIKMHPMLNIAIKAARRAGAIISRASNDLDKLTVELKAPNDFVSEVDRAAEAAIIEVLKQAYPQHSILAEESGESKTESDYQWIIDPLDGTTNFLHGFPQYCVSIALSVKGSVSQGVIYDPTRNELFTASKGGGAFLNDRRLRVSKKIQLQECLIGTGFPSREMHNFDRYIATFKDLTPKCAGIRRPGAAALDLAYVAAGRYDGFWEMGLSAWDMAAGALMIKEAGGLVTDFAGEDGYLLSGTIVAATPKAFPALLQIIQAHK